MMYTHPLAHIEGSFRCVYSSTSRRCTWAFRRSPPVLCLRHINVLAPRVSRGYTTHRDKVPSLLTSALDQRQHTPNLKSEDSVGPFQLGISRASLRRGERVKKWSELSTSGKVIRTTQRATNLTVILLGAGLSAVLFYALTSELLSKNSPTVLYNDACERIKVSNRVAKYLHGPLTFHNSPPSAIRPRHRNRHVASQIAVDSSGREHMLLNFYVQGSPASPLSASSEDNEIPWSDFFEELTTLTLEDIKAKVVPIVDSMKRAFRYLSGDLVPSPTTPAVTEKVQNMKREDNEERLLWGLTGLFSGLRSRRPHNEGRGDTGMTWTEGEVHADLVRNDEGYFVFRYLLIDIPNSENRSPVRVFVERAPGVRENEPIMRFHSS